MGMKKNEVIARAMRQLSYIEKAETQLENNPEATLDKVRVRSGGGEEGIGLESIGVPDRGVSLLEEGAEALKKVKKQGAKAKLTENEVLGLEAVILVTGRPALLVQDNSFPAPPPGWEVLEDHRKAIEKTFPSVGAIDVIVGGVTQQIGTGFLVGKDVLMTNKHVAVNFAKQAVKGWTFITGRGAAVDYRREKDRDVRRAFRIKSILGLHKTLDMALLEVDTKPISGKAKLPPPLTVATKAPKLSEHVYVVGYPIKDMSGVTPSAVIADIFGEDFGVKRLQPGEYDGALTPASLFSHDCSTLNGSSGSCVLSLNTHEVVGLHFFGTFQVTNKAVSLWKLKNDPMLKGRVEFAA